MARTAAGARTAASGRFSVSYRDTILGTSGLIGYWRLGESSGSSIDSKNAFNGTIGGTVNRAATGLLIGDSDKSTDFVAGWSALPANATLTPASVTMEAWVNTDTVAAGVGRITRKNGLYAFQRNGALLSSTFVNVNGGNYTLFSTAFVVGTTIFVAASWDASSGVHRNYVNGTTNEATQALSGSLVQTTSALHNIGGNNVATEMFDGRIDELAIYNRALTPAELKAHYQLGASSLSRTVAGARTAA